MLPNLEYKLIRQNRKTLSISIKNQILIIKAPLKLETNQIQNFVNEKENWIKKQIKSQREKLEKENKLNLDFGQDEFWQVNLESILNKKVDFWLSELQNKNENRQKIEIKIIVKKYRTKWGSCSYFGPQNHQKQSWELNQFQNLKTQSQIQSQITKNKINLTNLNPKIQFQNYFYKTFYKTRLQKPKNQKEKLAKVKIEMISLVPNSGSNLGQIEQKNWQNYSQNPIILIKKSSQNSKSQYQPKIYSTLQLTKFANLLQKVKNFSQDLFENWQKSGELNQSENWQKEILEKENKPENKPENWQKQLKDSNSQISNSKLNSKKHKTKNKFQFLNQINYKKREKTSTILPDKCELKFNLRLGYVPEFVLDYVIVHELSHLWEPNHSLRFWKVVESVLDSKNAKLWLKNTGSFYL